MYDIAYAIFKEEKNKACIRCIKINCSLLYCLRCLSVTLLKKKSISYCGFFCFVDNTKVNDYWNEIFKKGSEVCVDHIVANISQNKPVLKCLLNMCTKTQITSTSLHKLFCDLWFAKLSFH